MAPGLSVLHAVAARLHRAGLTTVERDVWTDRDAAARLRAATGGDETVPTVFLGERVLVNPSPREVLDAARAVSPHDPQLACSSTGLARRWWPAALWTVLVGVAWLGLAAWRPETTWHLAPLLLGGVAPWLVGQDSVVGIAAAAPGCSPRAWSGGPWRWRCRSRWAPVGCCADLAWPGWARSRRRRWVAGIGAVLATASGMIRTRRQGLGSWSAWAGSMMVAASADVVVVEGNAYFPRDALTGAELRPSAMTTVCPWKGVARYYDVVVDGATFSRAAWSYPAPWLIARRIKKRVAFESSITVARDPAETTR